MMKTEPVRSQIPENNNHKSLGGMEAHTEGAATLFHENSDHKKYSKLLFYQHTF